MTLDLEGLSRQQLLKKLEAFKTSNAPTNIKTEAIRLVEDKLGINDRREEVLRDIEESSADINDLE